MITCGNGSEAANVKNIFAGVGSQSLGPRKRYMQNPLEY